MMPPGSLPGMMSFARAPTTRPKMIHPRIPVTRASCSVCVCLPINRSDTRASCVPAKGVASPCDMLAPHVPLCSGDCGATLLVCADGIAAVPAAQERTTLSPSLTDAAHAAHLARAGRRTGSGGGRSATACSPCRGLARRAGPFGVPRRWPSSRARISLTWRWRSIRSPAAMPDVTPRRDVLLIVGYQSTARFYYVHLSAARDAVHNGIFSCPTPTVGAWTTCRPSHPSWIGGGTALASSEPLRASHRATA